MNVKLPLDEMTTADKLAAMEQLWAALSRDQTEVPSPSWHRQVLAAREQGVNDGSASFSLISDVRDRLRNTKR